MIQHQATNDVGNEATTPFLAAEGCLGEGMKQWEEKRVYATEYISLREKEARRGEVYRGKAECLVAVVIAGPRIK